MPLNTFTQNTNSPNTTSGYEKTKLRKLLLTAVGVLMAIAIIVLMIHLLGPNSHQSKYLKSATTAARKQTPNAKVADVKVSDGFALATVSDPTAKSQAASGNLTYFKVNKDGSMAQIANGSSFTPADLLGLGIPLATQAKLSGRNLSQTQQYLADTCGYEGGNAPGYLGFNGSFNPGGWQIDAGTLNDIEQTLTAVLNDKNAQTKFDEKIICVNATRGKSSASTNQQTYTTTFALNLQFIKGSGTLTSHPFTFAVGPNHYRTYTLDGKIIQNE